MGVVEKIKFESVRIPELEAADANGELPLDPNTNPFSSNAAGTRLGRSLQTAFGEVIRHIGLQTSVVVVLGAAGTGKTVLAEMVARSCSDMGISVRRAESGHLLEQMMGQSSDVLLVDEADSMSGIVLQACLAAPAKSIAGTIVFLCLPSCVTKFSFSGSNAAVLELGALSLSDARAYLNERGSSIGRRGLFAAEAMDLLVDSSRGVPRLLRSIASLAYFTAASDGAPQIQGAHVDSALQMRGEFAQAGSLTNAPSPVTSEAVAIPDLEAHGAQAAAPVQAIPIAETVRRPRKVVWNRLPLRVGLSGVALAMGLLSTSIIGVSLFGRFESQPAESHGAMAVVRPATSETLQTSPQAALSPAAASELNSPAITERPKGQPAFRTAATLARGDIQRLSPKAGKASPETPVQNASLPPAPKTAPAQPGKVAAQRSIRQDLYLSTFGILR